MRKHSRTDRVGDNPSTRIIAVANQKGGVGKTTTTINLATAFAEVGIKTVVVDFDPQGNASTGLGFGLNDRKLTIDDVISGNSSLSDAVVRAHLDKLYLLPSSQRLSSADIAMVNEERRLSFLADAFDAGDMERLQAAYVLIDCPPSLNLLTLNAMVASHSILAPLQAEFFALEGLVQLIGTMRKVRQSANPKLHLEGVLLTMVDKRNNLSRQVENDARENLKKLVFDTVIPRTVKLSEAPSHGLPALIYDKNSKGSIAYRNLAAEILQNQKIHLRKLKNGKRRQT